MNLEETCTSAVCTRALQCVKALRSHEQARRPGAGVLGGHGPLDRQAEAPLSSYRVSTDAWAPPEGLAMWHTSAARGCSW